MPPTLHDLPTLLLLNVISWLPPLSRYKLCLVSRRLRKLASSAESTALVVSADPAVHAGRKSYGAAPKTFTSLAAAVGASLPGDVVLLQAGEAFPLAQGVEVRWPLTLRARGGGPQDRPVIECGSPCEAGLICRASCRLIGVKVAAFRCATILHCSGRLLVEDCCLTTSSPNLEWLYPPIITLADSTPAPVHQSGAGSSSKLAQLLRRTRQEKRKDVGAGVLTVLATAITGGHGSRAVLCQGSGQVQAVRALPLHHGTLFWFTVDSSAPAEAGPEGRLISLPLPESSSPLLKRKREG